MSAADKQPVPGVEAWIPEALLDLQAQGLLRRLVAYPETGGRIRLDGAEVLNFSSNDYLALARHPEVVGAAVRYAQRYGAGATASRLVCGTLDCHAELERQIAALKGYPAALVFGSGYSANLGIIPALLGPHDHAFLDRRAHASLVDGVVLSRARLHRFRHNDPEDLRRLLRQAPAAGRRLILTESVFSMDGDLAPLGDLARAAAEGNAMVLVDEAHATGVFGPRGAGCVAAAGLAPAVNLSMGTLSKALGGYGAFVACSEPLRDWLIQRARAFIYSTALPPAAVGSALGALRALAAVPGRGAELLARAAEFRRRLQQAGFDTGASQSQIIPLLMGANELALRFAGGLRASGLVAVAIRPPTVPPGTARVRLSVTLAHSRADLARAAEVLTRVARAEGVL